MINNQKMRETRKPSFHRDGLKEELRLPAVWLFIGKRCRETATEPSDRRVVSEDPVEPRRPISACQESGRPAAPSASRLTLFPFISYALTNKSPKFAD